MVADRTGACAPGLYPQVQLEIVKRRFRFAVHCRLARVVKLDEGWLILANLNNQRVARMNLPRTRPAPQEVSSRRLFAKTDCADDCQ